MLNLHDERRRLKQGDRSRLRHSCVPLVSTGAPEPASLQSTSCGTLRRDPNDPRAAMRRVTSWLLFLLALAALALGVAERVGFLHLAAPPLAFGVAAAVFAALLAHPLPAAKGSPADRFPCDARAPCGLDRRARLFPVRHQAEHGQGFHERRHRAEADGGDGRSRQNRAVAASTERNRDAARLSGHLHRAAGGGQCHRHPFRVGRRRQCRRPLDQYRRFGRAGGPRQRPRPAQERRGDARAAKNAGGRGQHPAIECRTRRWRRGTRRRLRSSARGR